MKNKLKTFKICKKTNHNKMKTFNNLNRNRSICGLCKNIYNNHRKKNQSHFSNGGLFSALIDYGKDLKGKFSLDEQ